MNFEPMQRFAHSLFFVVFSIIPLLGDNDVKKSTAPNKTLTASAEHHLEDERVDLGWDVVRIKKGKRCVAFLSLKEGSGINRAGVIEAVWSPDSRFFVFQTNSTGGHSAWHCPTYTFDSLTSHIYSIDDTLGPTTVSKDRFTIDSDETLTLEFYNFYAKTDDDPYSFRKTIHLADFVRSAKRALHSY